MGDKNERDKKGESEMGEGKREGEGGGGNRTKQNVEVLWKNKHTKIDSEITLSIKESEK